MQKPCLYVAVSPVAAITKIAGWFLCVCCVPLLSMHAWRNMFLFDEKYQGWNLQFIHYNLYLKEKSFPPPNKPEKSTDCWYPKETCSFIQARHTVYTYFSLSYNILSLMKNRKNLKILQNVFWEIARFFLWKECCIVERNHQKQTKIRKSFFPENEFSELESTFGSIHREDMSRDKTSIDCICVSSIIS